MKQNTLKWNLSIHMLAQLTSGEYAHQANSQLHAHDLSRSKCTDGKNDCFEKKYHVSEQRCSNEICKFMFVYILVPGTHGIATLRDLK